MKPSSYRVQLSWDELSVLKASLIANRAHIERSLREGSSIRDLYERDLATIDALLSRVEKRLKGS